MTASATPLDALLAEFRASHSVAHCRHAGETWRYRCVGVGAKPVMWLTGVLGRGEFAFAQILALGDGFRVLAPDYPPVHSLDHLVEGLVAILDAEGLGAVHVISGSFGGMVAQHLVRRHPERVRSLVLSHTAAPESDRARMAMVKAMVGTLGVWPGWLVRALFRRRLRGIFAVADPFWLRYFDSTVAGLSQADLVSRVRLAAEFAGQTGYGPHDLDRWPGRVLIMDADDDPHMPAATRAALRALYPQAEVHSFSGTGHSAAIMNPEGYAQVIRRFLVPGATEPVL
ncbi:MAG: alpha/beta hydrolase [Gemmatimonadetes bacterium]|nr:alpha/beta hydrolase [Gemmatimonadota bacterium]